MSSAISVTPLLLHDTEVSPTRTRRQFTATYQRQMFSAAASVGDVTGDTLVIVSHAGQLYRRRIGS